MTELEPLSHEDQERLKRTLVELSQEFGMQALVDTIVMIDDERWNHKLEPAKRFMEPDSPFTVSFDKATDQLR
ncbi:hypothetical protein LRY29_02165 [Candidatus Saccharibacteria bacterium]|nr:hypothetical protein [Candidatus Saccharibacteria bacterium]